MKLATALDEAGTSDCTKVPTQCASTLANPEPGYFILGAKSYGRAAPSFLLETGYRQVSEAIAAIAERAGLRAPQEARG